MFRYNRNGWPFIPPKRDSGGRFLIRLPADSECARAKTMDKAREHIRSKGGRPRKAVKKDQLLGMKCTLIERRAIEIKAKSVNLTVSEYIRYMSLTGKIDRPKKVLPKEVLQFTGTLNHLAANMNQVAKKRNGVEELNPIERATLQALTGEIKKLAQNIKTYLQ